DDAELVARVSDPNVVANALLALSRAGVAAAEFASSQPSLDEVFLTLTGHTVEVAGADEEEVA
ncbi:MAG TPA: daunorubicin/doxorubicin resistance ABC transporter ATP-binding protein DrrA, partial [Acidimicrobiia bacterium]|nr:daunorubicin/doxorubicin resistance ABC transporter ATP-binding protein DrrA [Acidimicrobiia bacterium]